MSILTKLGDRVRAVSQKNGLGSEMLKVYTGDREVIPSPNTSDSGWSDWISREEALERYGPGTVGGDGLIDASRDAISDLGGSGGSVGLPAFRPGGPNDPENGGTGWLGGFDPSGGSRIGGVVKLLSVGLVLYVAAEVFG